MRTTSLNLSLAGRRPRLSAEALLALIITILLLLAALSASAVTVADIRTGVDESNNNALLANGVADVNWTITSVTGSGDGTIPRTATAIATGLPGGWAGNAVAGTEFITRGTSTVGTDSVTYTYQTTFTLDTANYGSFLFSGNTWADNTVSVILNGHNLGTSANLSALSFSTANQSFFVGGLNTLQLVVGNNVTDTGVSFAGTITAVNIPEAAEWAMILGATALLMIQYRQPLISHLTTLRTRFALVA